MAEPLLTIGYSVLGARAGGIKLPAPRPDVEILIVAQGALSPDAPARDDVRYELLDSVGVAKSRNRVLDCARGRYVLFADDDIVVNLAGVQRLVDELEHDDELALVLAAAVDEEGRLRKHYPTRRVALRRWNCGKAATYEIIVRRAAIQRAGVRFDERFGAGAELYLGDEYVFIADSLGAGLRCLFFPHVVAVHPSQSSGSRFGTSADAAARSVVFSRVFGRGAIVARLAFVVRSPRRFGDPRLTARFVLGRCGCPPKPAAHARGARCYVHEMSSSPA